MKGVQLGMFDQTMPQKDRVKRFLDDFGSITPVQAMEEFGCMRLAARIGELQAEGENIKMRMLKSKNRYGQVVHYAQYYKEA